MSSPVKEVKYSPLEKADKKWNICVSFPHMKDAYWLAVDYGVAEEAKELGVTMHLGTAAISFGIALTLTSGVPVYGLPDAFGTIFNFSRILDIPSPVYVTAGLFVAMYVLLNRTRMGRYFYAVGGNVKASRLSGIDTRLYLFLAYVLCGALAAVAGALLTARLETGEANIGASMPLDSIAA
jgi:ribose/xylose/arabinose/galactoside ABC-type transport system permease subunit